MSHYIVLYDKDYGIVQFDHIRKPFIMPEKGYRTRKKGFVKIHLTKGRAKDGSIIPGQKITVKIESILAVPPHFITALSECMEKREDNGKKSRVRKRKV